MQKLIHYSFHRYALDFVHITISTPFLDFRAMSPKADSATLEEVAYKDTHTPSTSLPESLSPASPSITPEQTTFRSQPSATQPSTAVSNGVGNSNSETTPSRIPAPVSSTSSPFIQSQIAKDDTGVGWVPSPGRMKGLAVSGQSVEAYPGKIVNPSDACKNRRALVSAALSWELVREGCCCCHFCSRLQQKFGRGHD